LIGKCIHVVSNFPCACACAITVIIRLAQCHVDFCIAGVSPTLQLDTKYYTASVALVDAAPGSAAQHPASATAECVILLLSRQDARSFDTLTQAVQSADANADVQLCVYDSAVKPDGGCIVWSPAGERTCSDVSST
jgi:hypothetical protein